MWEERLALYDRLIALCPGIERLGKGMPYTGANTYMYSALNKDGEIGIRLPKETAKRLAAEFGATEFRSYGAVMKDYVRVPEELLIGDLARVADWLEQSRAYVMSLPPQKRKR